MKRLAEARQAAASDRSDLVVSHQEGEREIEMPLIDPQSGADKLVPVRLVDSRDIRPLDVRPRPAGYLVMRGDEAVAQNMALNEVADCDISRPARIAVEAYDVTRVEAKTSRESINPDQSVKVKLRAATIDVPVGALFVPMAQPAAGIVASALEPDSPGSYVGVGLIPMKEGETEAPVYRVMPGAALSLEPRGASPAALCSLR